MLLVSRVTCSSLSVSVAASSVEISWNYSFSKHLMGGKFISLIFLTRSIQCTSPLLHRHFLPTLAPLLFNPFSTSSEATSHSKPNTESPFTFHEDCSPPTQTTVAQFAISKFSHIWEKKADSFPYGAPLKLVIESGLDLSPEILRRFLRASEIKPDNFLEILLGFAGDVNLREVTYLWKVFRWCELQSGDFHHLPRSSEIMVSLLTRAEMLDEAKFLLLSMVRNNIVLSGYGALFSNLIEAYVKASKGNDSLSLFDQARGMDLILSGSSYKSLLNSLIKIPNDELVLRVFLDMIDAGLGSYSEKPVLDIVVMRLANSGKLVQVIKLIQLLKDYGIEPGLEAVSSIAEGFCVKKDFGDMMKFLEVQAIVPKTETCNKIVNSLCTKLGSMEAWVFVQKMEKLGFKPDAATFGNLICQSCKDGDVRDALIYLSECLSRKIMPRVYFYNSIIGGIFKKRMYRHVTYVYDDMLENGIKPDLYTFRILLAGYCKYRKLDEVQRVIEEVNNSDIISDKKGDWYFSKAMSILGLGHLAVKLKRDNSIGFKKSEFFDNLGNGLYLDMDIDELESSLDEVLDLATVPNLNVAVINELKQNNVRSALEMQHEAVQLGKDLSFEAYKELLRCLLADVQYLEDSVRILDGMPELLDNLDSRILNSAIRVFSANKMADKACLLLDRLISNEMQVERESYSSLLFCFCKERDIHGFKKYWDLAKKCNWSPEIKELEVIFGFLLNCGAIGETLELLESIEQWYPRSSVDAYKLLMKLLSSIGYTDLACAIAEGILNSGVFLDNSSLLCLIKGFVKERQYVVAQGLYSIWLERNITLDAGTLHLVLPLVLKFGCDERIICLIKSSEEILPTSILELCLKLKMKEENSIFQGMSLNNFNFDETCLNALLQGNCTENNFKHSLEILCYMLRKGVCISISGFRALTRQMCAMQNFEKALKFSNIVQSESMPTIICKNILIYCFFRMRSKYFVDRVLTEMQHMGIDPDNVTYEFLIHGYHKCGDTDKLIEAFDASTAKGFEMSNRSLRIVMSHFCQISSLDKAFELFNLSKFNKWKCGSSVVNSFGLYLISSGRCLDAQHVCEKDENFYFDPLIRHFCMKGEVKTAISLANKMLKRGNIPCEITYSRIIYDLIHCNEIDTALDFFTEMEFRQLRPSKISSETLIRVLCDLGRLHDAKSVLERMIQVGTVPSYEIYNIVLEKYHEARKLEIAAEITREMQKAGHKPKFETQWSIISELCSSGDKLGKEHKTILPRILSSSGGAQLKKLKR